MMTTEAFIRNFGKLFSQLKLVTDNLLFIQTLLTMLILNYYVLKSVKLKHLPEMECFLAATLLELLVIVHLREPH